MNKTELRTDANGRLFEAAPELLRAGTKMQHVLRGLLAISPSFASIADPVVGDIIDAIESFERATSGIGLPTDEGAVPASLIKGDKQ